MSAKHTPGPWSESETRDGYIMGGEGDDRYTIANTLVRSGYPSQALRNHAEMKANAQLIAAAPELLEALKALTEWGRTHTSPRDQNSPHNLLIAACAAITKAEGRTE